MNDTLLRELIAEYDRLRDKKEQELREREREVLQKIPEIAICRDKVISLLAQKSKELIKNPDKAADTVKALDKEVEELKNKEIKLLEEHGYTADYLSIRYTCPHCRDTGFVGFPIKEKCKCLVQKMIERTYGYMKDIELGKENFDTFDLNVFPDTPLQEVPLTQREYMDKIRQRLLLYQSDYPDNKQKNILFTGKTGLGKTFLLNCLAKSILDKSGTVLKVSSYNLFEQLFQARLSNNIEAERLKIKIFTVDTLIIDDLGTETKRNNFTAEELFNILNERFIAGKHTFLSTNLMLTQLKDCYSDRVTSRLFDVENTVIIRFLGEDIRLLPRHSN